MDTQLQKSSKIQREVIYFLTHIKQNFNYYTYLVKVDLFSGSNIYIARCRHHSGNNYGGQKSRSSFSLAGVALIPAMKVYLNGYRKKGPRK